MFALIVFGTIFLLYYVLEGQANITGAVLSMLRTIIASFSWLVLTIAFFFLGRAIADKIEEIAWHRPR